MGVLFSSNEYTPRYNPNEYNKKRPGKNIYNIDNNYVYWRGRKVNGANGLNFTDYGYGYGKDNKHVFYIGFVLQKTNLDTFSGLENKYAIDNTNLYYKGEINSKNSE